MPKTPEKKRSASLSVSPMGQQKLSENDEKKKFYRKRTGKYHFTPIDDLNCKSTHNSHGLKSISVSQVRKSTTTRKTLQEAPDLSTLDAPCASDTMNMMSRPRELMLDDNMANPDPSTAQGVRTEQTSDMTEQVVWRYIPQHARIKHTSAKISNLSDTTAFEKETNQPRHSPSSTPIVPNKWRTIMNLNNISDDGNKSPSCKHTHTNDQRFAQSQIDQMSYNNDSEHRDIEEILNDIEYNVSKRANDFLDIVPSSPTPMVDQPQQRLCDKSLGTKSIETDTVPSKVGQINDLTKAVDHKEQDNIAHDLQGTEGDDDDSLIDILTQNFHEKSKIVNAESVKTGLEPTEANLHQSDDQISEFLSSDDSLLYTRLCKNELDKLSPIRQPNNSKSLEESLTQIERYKKLAQTAYPRKGVVRLVIFKVQEVKLQKIGLQKILTCIDSDGKKSSVLIRHIWAHLEYKEGDVVHIIEGCNFANKRLLSEDKDPITNVMNDNLLILNPDLLLSATTVGGSVDCARRSLIQYKYQDIQGEISLPMTVGNIVHELLQDSFERKALGLSLNTTYMEDTLDRLLQKHEFDLILSRSTVSAVKQTIMQQHFTNILDFINRFVMEDNFRRYVSLSGSEKKKPTSISNVMDVEENIWSHVYGLKGFLDLTVEIKVERNKSLAPLEIKTGKFKSMAHIEQGEIYTLLLQDRYELPIDYFLLFYTQESDMILYPRTLFSLKHVIMSRNNIASKLRYLTNEATHGDEMDNQLPAILGNSFCDMCFSKVPCMTLYRLLEGGNARDSGLVEGEFESIVHHLGSNTTKYQEFLKKYNDLISREESSISAANKDLFLMESTIKEQEYSDCLSRMHVLSIKESEDSTDTMYRFSKSDDDRKVSLLEFQLHVGDRVVISDEVGHFNLAQGVVKLITKDIIEVATEKRLINRNRYTNLQNTSKIQSAVNMRTMNEAKQIELQEKVCYRIDKNNIQQSLSTARYNVLNLFLPPIGDSVMLQEANGQKRYMKKSEGGDFKMRQYLIDEVGPRFRDSDKDPEISYSVDRTKFNEDQIRAIDKVMRCEDYTLILGMPGSGKTTVVAEIIKLLVNNGSKSVLLTSYTHSAVDNILLKLNGTRFKIARLGAKHKIHPDNLKYVPDYSKCSTYNDYFSQIENYNIVATTCLGIRDIMFSMRENDFDYVIMDEASQVSLPIALGPLRFGTKFIMVGDHFQLPPLIKNSSARSGGLEMSIFQILCSKHPESIAELTHQYRMCDEIMKLSNCLIYNGKLKCGSEAVARQKLEMAPVRKLDQYENFEAEKRNPWLHYVLDPKSKVIFVNHDECGDTVETATNNIIINEGECQLVDYCVTGLVACGVPEKNIGVMTIYRSQLTRLQYAMKKFPEVETMTVDQFQGRDKECVIISLVRSNEASQSGVLLKELRRVNVAMSRAKSKLIIIGSQKMMSSVIELSDLMNLLRQEQWIYDLKDPWQTAYNFDKYLRYRATNNTSQVRNSYKTVKTLLKNNVIAREVLDE